MDVSEFAGIQPAFGPGAWAARQEFNRFEAKRQRVPGATGNAGALPIAKARFLFVFFYFKCYPLQKIMGVLFGFEPVAYLPVDKTPDASGQRALGQELCLSARRPRLRRVAEGGAWTGEPLIKSAVP